MPGTAQGKPRGSPAVQSRSKQGLQPQARRWHAGPTIGVFVAVLRWEGGTGLPIRGALTAVQLSHRRGPWQVFNDLDFNWMGGGEGGGNREKERERKGLEKTISNTRGPQRRRAVGGKDLRTKFPGALHQLGHLIPSTAPSRDRPEVGHIPNRETLLLPSVFPAKPLWGLGEPAITPLHILVCLGVLAKHPIAICPACVSVLP